MKKISVISTTHNERENIIACILNVRQQKKVIIEHIIVDDFSTDDTVEIVKNFIREPINSSPNYQLKLIRGTTKGRSYALNQGLSNASYDLVCILDADDEWQERKLEIQSYVIERLNIAVLGTNLSFKKSALFQFEENFSEPFILSRVKTIGDRILLNNKIAHSSVMLDRKKLNNLLIYPIRNSQIDYGLWLNLYSHNVALYKLDLALTYRKIGVNQSFESKRHLRYTYNSVKLQYKYILKTSKKKHYLLILFLRMLWGTIPQKIRIYLHLLWE